MKKLFFTFAFLLLPFYLAHAVPLFDAASSVATAPGGVSSITHSHTATTSADRLITVCVYHGYDGGLLEAVTGVTFNGVALTQVANVIQANTAARLWLYQLIAPASGTHDAVVTFNQLVNAIVGVMSFSAVHQTVPLGTAVTQGSAAAVQEGELVLASATDELGMDCFGTLMTLTDSIVTTPGTGQTPAKWANSGDAGNADGSTKAGAATSLTMMHTWDSGFNYMAYIGVSLKPVAAAPSGVARRRLRIND